MKTKYPQEVKVVSILAARHIDKDANILNVPLRDCGAEYFRVMRERLKADKTDAD